MSEDVEMVRRALTLVDEPDQVGTCQQMLDLLSDRPDPLSRSERPGHFTGSALVLDEQRERLLVLLHAKLGIWVQPGGHADGDANLAHVALREATEETGMRGLSVWNHPIDLDIHRVDPPREDAHDHHDVRFVVVASRHSVLDPNDESHDQRWVTERELAGLGADRGLRRLARRGLSLAQTLPEANPSTA